jgi:hypothetical protein
MENEITKEDYKNILKSLNEAEKLNNKFFYLFVTNFVSIISYWVGKFIDTENTQYLDIGVDILLVFIIFMMIVSFINITKFNKNKEERKKLKEQLKQIA